MNSQAMSFPIATPNQADLLPSLQIAIEEVCRNAVSQEKPFLLHTIGVPGSGKSSLVDALDENLADQSPSVVGFDRLMIAMPEYQNAAEINLEEAFSLYQLPAREAGYVLVKKLMGLKANIIFDHTAAHANQVELMKYAKEQGYSIVLVRIIAETNDIKARIKKRTATGGRHTPLEYVDDRLAIIEGLLDKYQAVADTYFEVRNDDVPVPEQREFFKTASEQIGAKVRALTLTL